MKEYSKRCDVKYFPIERKDLVELFELIKGDIPLDSGIYISTKIGTLSITENSVEALLAHKEIPDLLSNYNIYMVNFDSNKNI